MIEGLKASILSLLHWRKVQYQQSFLTETGKDVLADLAHFCRANESTFHPDPHVRCQLDGRREVWLRIQNHLRLTDDELFEIYGRKTK
jgi:hypothetical protein